MKKMIIIIVVAVALLLGGISTYNGLVGKQQGVDAAWAQVSNQYQRRADLVPNLELKKLPM
jgi:LemA protein